MPCASIIDRSRVEKRALEKTACARAGCAGRGIRQHAVDPDGMNALSRPDRISESSCVEDGFGIEEYEVGVKVFPDQTALMQIKSLRRQAGHFMNGGGE